MSSKTLVLIDSRVANSQALLSAQPANSVLLNAEEDGVLQIARALAGYTELDSIHIVSHGSPATLYLGSGELHADNLAQYQTALQTIGQALSATGDVLLYGCNVAAGAAGQAFVAAMAAYTGADVAASEDLTGTVELGGDGVLEYGVGDIAAEALSLAGVGGVLVVNTAPTFGVAGLLTTNIGFGSFNSYDYGYSVSLQADGKILVVGTSSNNFALARYNRDGSLDTSFSGDGLLTTNVGSSNPGKSVTLQADGKIVVVGTGSYNFALTRYNTDGSLDTTFNSDGLLTTDFGFGSYYDNAGNSVSVQADGKILVAGTMIYSPEGSNFALARYNTDGSLDTSFSSDGLLTTDFGSSSSDYGNSVTLQTDGKILVAGTSNNNFALARYNTDGSLDTTFNSDGLLTTDFGFGSYYDNAGNSVSVQADGKIVLAGTANSNFALARYNTDGSLDTSFSDDGKLTTDFGPDFDDDGNSVTLQSDGKIVLAGTSNNNFALARYNSDGSLDTTFSSDGLLTTDFGSTDSGNSVTLQADGKIVLAGASYGNGNYNFALARYNTDGSLDTSFGNALNTDAPPIFSGNIFSGNDVVLDTNVQIVDTEFSANSNYSGAMLMLSRSAGANSDDVFSAKTSGTLSALTQDSFFSVGGISIGRVLSNSNGQLQLGFNSQATQTLVSQAMQQIAYSNSATTPPVQVQIDWTFNDGNTGSQGTGGALSVTGNTQVIITANNKVPVVANALVDVSIMPNRAFSHVLPATTFSDANEGTKLTYSISMNNGTILPTWLSFDSMARTLSGNPGDLGVFDLTEFDIKVTATDHVNAAVSDVFRLSVTAPVVEDINGDAGNNTLTGTAGANVMNGLAGHDTLDGGAGADAMLGGDGNDLYKVDNVGDTVTETNANLAIGGNDTVWSSVSFTLGTNVENLRLLVGNIDGTGNALNNILYAGDGNNRLDGGAGVDTVSYQYATAEVNVNLASALTQATGGSGNDALLNIENLTGSNFDDTLLGNAAANILDGGLGSDVMIGGLGNDTYIVNDIDDMVKEAKGTNGGIDLIKSSLTWSLGAHQENLTLTGSKAINATGNALANTLTGNGGNNILSGGAANDTLSGGTGNDTLIGGAGKDKLTGGAGNDIFVFNVLSEMGVSATSGDVIADFVRGKDKIDLRELDANQATGNNDAFSAPTVGGQFSGSFANAGELYFDQVARVLYGNTDADAAAEFAIVLTGVKTLSAVDFML